LVELPTKFLRETTSEEFHNKLAWLCATDPVNVTLGIHLCELCRSPAKDRFYSVRILRTPSVTPQPIMRNTRFLLGSAEIRVPGDKATYASPTLIIHYVVKHRYRPPDEFVDAVLRGS
jgi:hypothetical protein